MKILVDEKPETPEDCLFSEESHGKYVGYVCTLRENISGKPKNTKCICKDTSKCNCLKEL